MVLHTVTVLLEYLTECCSSILIICMKFVGIFGAHAACAPFQICLKSILVLLPKNLPVHNGNKTFIKHHIEQ